MSVEMSAEIIKDIMQPTEDLFEATLDTATTVVIENILQGKVALVRGAGDFPMGVLTRKTSFRLLGAEDQLRNHQEQFALAGFTTPETTIDDVLSSMAFDKAVSWFIVMEEDSTVGIVTPHSLFQLVASNTKYGQIFIDPPIDPPSTLCYCCPQQTTHSAHTVTPTSIKKRNPITRQALCPTHNDLIYLKIPCVNC